METISPELALVDERLDAAARVALPEGGDCLRPSRARDRTTLTPGVERVRARAVAKLAWLPIGLLALAIGLATLPWRSTQAGSIAMSEDVPAVPTTKPAATPGKDAAVSRALGTRLRWKSVPGADFYNVILWRNGRRALDLWPAAASLYVTADMLKPGAYQWFVYPAFESGTSRRYGLLVAKGQFTI